MAAHDPYDIGQDAFLRGHVYPEADPVRARWDAGVDPPHQGDLDDTAGGGVEIRGSGRGCSRKDVAGCPR